MLDCSIASTGFKSNVWRVGIKKMYNRSWTKKKNILKGVSRGPIPPVITPFLRRRKCMDYSKEIIWVSAISSQGM